LRVTCPGGLFSEVHNDNPPQGVPLSGPPPLSVTQRFQTSLARTRSVRTAFWVEKPIFWRTPWAAQEARRLIGTSCSHPPNHPATLFLQLPRLSKICIPLTTLTVSSLDNSPLDPPAAIFGAVKSLPTPFLPRVRKTKTCYLVLESRCVDSSCPAMTVPFIPGNNFPDKFLPLNHVPLVVSQPLPLLPALLVFPKQDYWYKLFSIALPATPTQTKDRRSLRIGSLDISRISSPTSTRFSLC